MRFLFVFLILFLLSFHLYFASGLFSMIAFRSLAIIYVNTLLCVVNKFIGVCPLLLQPMPPALLLPLLARGFACGTPCDVRVSLYAFPFSPDNALLSAGYRRARACGFKGQTAP